MVYVASIAKLFFPWPIIVIIILIVALNVWGPDRIRDLVASGKFEVPGLFKYEGTGQVPEAFRKEMGDAQRAADRTNRAVKRPAPWPGMEAEAEAEGMVAAEEVILAVAAAILVWPRFRRGASRPARAAWLVQRLVAARW
jgi:hypothetical protein